jgi:cell division protein FtsB
VIKNRTARKKRRSPARVIFVLVLAIVFLGLVNSGRSLLKIRELTRLKQEEARTLQENVKKRTELQKEVYRLRNDSLYIEEIARREYGMLKAGEEPLLISLPDTTKGKTNAPGK